MEKLTMRVDEVAATLRTSTASVYRLIRSGELESTNVSPTGHQWGSRVLSASVTAFLERRRSKTVAVRGSEE